MVDLADLSTIDLAQQAGFFVIAVGLIRVIELLLGKWIHDKNGGRDMAELISKQNKLLDIQGQIISRLEILLDRTRE